MPIDRGRTLDYLKRFDFRALFIEELGWEHHDSKLDIPLDGKTYSLHAIAHKRGMAAFLCAVPTGEKVPEHALRQKIERQVAKVAHEHLIVFADAGQTVQIWQWVKREPGKPSASREHQYWIGQSGEGLFQKLEKIAFTLEEEEKLALPDVTRRTRQAFDVEKVTKRFFEQFQLEHKAFFKFIDGIDDTGAHEWYASLMLNRLMFIYFVQRKGFLDEDKNYLRNRLERNRKEQGKDKFYSFYRYFLLRLFHDGLGSKERSQELDKLLGRIPYLNGGLFEKHQVEKEFPEIKIPDSAFERIFAFFDKFNWHLDERPSHDDNEINPDVLGYIFEKYINQKQMGAYYTKEDITEYISKYTVLPFLFDAAKAKCKVAFENPDGPTVWGLLREDPDKYIFPAVRHGVDKKLPPEIAAGLDSSKPNLNERRKFWNKPASADYALPTETWREVVARRQRYEEVRKKLAAGEVIEVNDFITLNLDLRQFAQDMIANSEGPDLLRAVWHAIGKMTILDPTCGSGAFLFAALNILEPLYEGCLERMEAFIADEDRARPRSPEESIRELIASGESLSLEFKSTARWNVREGKADKAMEQVIVKTVAAFLNSNGGDLLIGVQDDGDIFGIEADQQLFSVDKRNRDTYENWLITQLLAAYGKQHTANLRISFAHLDGKDVCRISILPSSSAVYVKENNQESLYVRTGNSTRSLSTSETVAYHQQRFTGFKAPPVVSETKKTSNPKKYADFRDALKEVEKHPNLSYFIFKSIILKNLYGVDIMEEAVEICKLRLFLKLAAQVDPNYADKNLGIEPLPDIDFNIRAGNTLVGFATRAEIQAVGESDLLLTEEVRGVLEEAEDAQRLYETFLKSQEDGESPGEFKRLLTEKFKHTRLICDKFLAETYVPGISKKPPKKLQEWKIIHQPFHWFVEFHGIMSKGGFDVIIGNPPYVNLKKIGYAISSSYTCRECGDLFAVCTERSYIIGQKQARIGLIIPLSATSTTTMSALKQCISTNSANIWTSYFSASDQPASLFTGVRHRLMILLSEKGSHSRLELYTTRFLKWFNPERDALFKSIISYVRSNGTSFDPFCKISSKVELSILGKMFSKKSLAYDVSKSGFPIYYHNAPVHWGKVFDFVPHFKVGADKSQQSSHLKTIHFQNRDSGKVTLCFLNGSIFYWFNWQYSNCRDLSLKDILRAPIGINSMDQETVQLLTGLASKIISDFKKNKSLYSRVVEGVTTEFDSFYPAKSKTILDEIDGIFAKHYGFTDEELDFILNYDIKYRMGREAESDED